MAEIIDYKEGVERFSGHKELYEKYLARFLDGDDFNALKEQMARGDFAAAFVTAHNLKSATGNLSFDRLYEKMCEFTECLRDGADIPKATELFPCVEAEYIALLDELKKDR